MKFKIALLFSLAIPLMSCSYASAELVTVVDSGAIQTTTKVSEFATFGNNMVGMSVTAMFADNTSETLAWGAYGGNNGGVFGNGWYLRFTGDDGTGTFSSNFKLRNDSGKTMTGFHMDGGPGLTVFDRTYGGNFGTEGSRRGATFSTGSRLARDGRLVTAKYSNLVQLDGSSPIGDLYRNLWVDLGIGDAGLRSDKSFYFRQDTDNVLDLTSVPEPSSFAMFSLLFAGSALSSRRRRSSKS